jgi:hypothetical protein
MRLMGRLISPMSIPNRYSGAIRTWRSTPILHHSITPSLRAAGFEDEDDDEDENEALCESHRSHSDLLSAAGPHPKRDQLASANLARFLAGVGRGEPEGRDCGLGVGLLLGLFIAIN